MLIHGKRFVEYIFEVKIYKITILINLNADTLVACRLVNFKSRIKFYTFALLFIFQLWLSGFSISYSLAPGSLNGDKINATMYYVLCHLRMPLHEVNREDVHKTELNTHLHFPDRCYNGHHTL